MVLRVRKRKRVLRMRRMLREPMKMLMLLLLLLLLVLVLVLLQMCGSCVEQVRVRGVGRREAATAADGGKALAACQLVEAVQAQAAGQPAAHAGQAAGAVHVDHACRNV